MPTKEATMMVAVVVMPDGSVTFTLDDPTSIETVGKKWRKSMSSVEMQEHKDKKTQAGVIHMRMLARDFMKIEKKIVHD
jgi:hypothetical protein